MFKKDIQCQMPQEEVKRGLRNLVWKLIACDFDVPLEGNMWGEVKLQWMSEWEEGSRGNQYYNFKTCIIDGKEGDRGSRSFCSGDRVKGGLFEDEKDLYVFIRWRVEPSERGEDKGRRSVTTEVWCSRGPRTME